MIPEINFMSREQFPRRPFDTLRELNVTTLSLSGRFSEELSNGLAMSHQ